MRLYEVVYILDAALDESAATAKLEAFHELATAHGGEVSAVDHWGARQLAYPINKQTVGYYVVAHFTAAADALPEFERLLKLDEEVLRYLLVINEGEPTSGASILADVPARAVSEDDEDDEEDEKNDEKNCFINLSRPYANSTRVDTYVSFKFSIPYNDFSKYFSMSNWTLFLPISFFDLIISIELLTIKLIFFKVS